MTQVVVGGRPPVAPPPAESRAGHGAAAEGCSSRYRGALVALAGVAGWWFAAGRYTDVPNVIRLPKPAADAKLKAAGLHWRYGPAEHSTTIPIGDVATVSPSNRVVHGGTVTCSCPRTGDAQPSAGSR